MKGIDISSHNGKIDFNKIKDEVDFVIIRATYGRKEVDKNFKQNIDSCKLLNIPVGVYVYSYALNKKQAEEEAKFLIETIKEYKLEYPVFIDMEDADGYKKKNGMPTNAELVSICETECKLFEDSGYYAGIYASKTWFDTKLKSKKLDRFDKWLAWWTVKEKVIDTNIYGIWQYEDNGKVKGIRGNVDMNEAYRDYPCIIKEMNKEEIKPSDPIEFKPGQFVKVEVKFTGSLTQENALVELNNNQFWIGLDEFMPNIKENKYYIYGQIAFLKEFTSGIAFHYFQNGTKREFQLEVEYNKMKGIK